MRGIDWKRVIRESVARLHELERERRGTRQEVRVKALRLLKAGMVQTLRECGQMIGYSERTLKRWMQCYRAEGLEGLLVQRPWGGVRRRQLNDEALAGMQQRLQAEGFQDVRQAQEWVQQHYRITLSWKGMWAALRRLGAKPKTGRPLAVKRSEPAARAFKKTSLKRWRILSKPGPRMRLASV